MATTQQTKTIKYDINNDNEILYGLSVGDKVYFKASGTIKKQNNGEYAVSDLSTTITKITSKTDTNYSLKTKDGIVDEFVLKETKNIQISN